MRSEVVKCHKAAHVSQKHKRSPGCSVLRAWLHNIGQVQHGPARLLPQAQAATLTQCRLATAAGDILRPVAPWTRGACSPAAGSLAPPGDTGASSTVSWLRSPKAGLYSGSPSTKLPYTGDDASPPRRFPAAARAVCGSGKLTRKSLDCSHVLLRNIQRQQWVSTCCQGGTDAGRGQWARH
jgi:hypothetical protein